MLPRSKRAHFYFGRVSFGCLQRTRRGRQGAAARFYREPAGDIACVWRGEEGTNLLLLGLVDLGCVLQLRILPRDGKGSRPLRLNEAYAC